ncbi:MAG TPA: polysaccharide deacetylase family protein [Gemmatimonadales bacterium]|nr:polysaccharide deacetylase family protein [Gemmatimonadales bacterium]
MLLTGALLLLQAAAAPRSVAVTFDDLPVISVVASPEAARDTTTTRLLAAIRKHAVPAIGFVNENKLLDTAGALVPARVTYLRQWLSAGLELGNHTWSHLDLHRVTLQEYEAEIIRGDSVTRQLMTQAGRTLRYFRHPFLHTGRSLAVRDSLNQFLAGHGYRVAPVTIDNSDYVFAAAYDRARTTGNAALALRIRHDYLGYMDTVTAFYQHQSQAILGRELPQILLLHANRLNADTFDELAGMLERRGYRFVTLETALQDPAYSFRDEYAGPAGITWLHRWAMTAGMPGSTFRGEPEVAAWVADAATGRSTAAN